MDIIGSLKAQIETIWNFIVITFIVIFVLAFSYFGKRIYCYYKFRTIQDSNINTLSQKETTNDNNQTEMFYDHVLDVEYVEPLHKQTDTYNEMCDDNSLIEASKEDVSLNGKQIIENQADEKQSFDGKGDISLYITPCM